MVAVLHADRRGRGEGARRRQGRFRRAARHRSTRIRSSTMLIRTAPPAQERARKGDPAEGERARQRCSSTRYENGYGAHAPIRDPHRARQLRGRPADRMVRDRQTPFPDQERIAQALGSRRQGARHHALAWAARIRRQERRQPPIPWRPPRWRESPASRCRSRGPAPRSLSTTPSDRRPSSRSSRPIDGSGRIVSWTTRGLRGRHAKRRPVLRRTRPSDPGVRQLGGATPPACTSSRPVPGGRPAPTSTCSPWNRKVDIMAARAKVDPLEFRVEQHVGSQDAERAAGGRRGVPLEEGGRPERSRPTASPANRLGTYVALFVASARQPSTRASGNVKVKRIVCAQDMGQVINPDGARMQIEGCIAMGLGYALSETLRFEAARSWIATSTATSCRVSPGCRRSRPSWSRTTSSHRRAAASRRSSRWGESSPTRSSTRPERGCSACPSRRRR